ncbi:MAG: peptidylprolyl isomerase [Azonexus sp.]|jgi:peptidyl-prolyl cis-trans isomerase C|nr:peptidylprolyl isomerase [Betaproteobacteria bacterium]MBK8918177.1 peptidylprolyl isomerase [Betaproteobacteria bacterium]MBP6035394.1 peptidylprolyl isomerase [Azonexus sp.]MBP6906031.1 peptidylprolyl isomerase [Azonexus sp.]
MDQVVKLYSRKPRPVIVNGETIPEDAIAAATPDFADSPKPRDAAARALAVQVLLRQRAVVAGIEAEDEAAAIERLLAAEIPRETVSQEEVRRYYEGNPDRFSSGDLFQVRHILFDTRAGDEGAKERARQAADLLLRLKDHPEGFEAAARQVSACTSAEVGGQLGQLSAGSVVPEFWSALVAFGRAGLLPNPVETRFGLHLIQVDHCVRGRVLPFEIVADRIREHLADRRDTLAQREYVAGLIASAQISGVDFGDTSPAPPGPGLPLE